ncbi:MAG: hypothetical protein WC284_14920 [Candidimonas sp.]
MFLVFAGSVYYPSGGIDDMIGIFGTFDEAYECLQNTEYKLDDNGFVADNSFEWAYIWDSDKKDIVIGCNVEDELKRQNMISYYDRYGRDMYVKSFGEPPKWLFDYTNPYRTD